MSALMRRQIDKLKRAILTLASRTEEMLNRAIEAVEKRDTELALEVIHSDKEIDLLEVDTEEECLKTLALHQPVAFDLRYVVAVLKINNDLERIADMATNVAEQATYMSMEPILPVPLLDLKAMASRVQTMLSKTIAALINVDAAAAESIRLMDDEIDEMHRKVYDAFVQRVNENPNETRQLLHYVTLSRQLERIADHAVNIAEDVLYLARGEIIRHERLRSES